MRLYQVEIFKPRSLLRSSPGRFGWVQAEDYEHARRKARFDLCGEGEDVCWICELPRDDAEVVLV